MIDNDRFAAGPVNSRCAPKRPDCAPKRSSYASACNQRVSRQSSQRNRRHGRPHGLVRKLYERKNRRVVRNPCRTSSSWARAGAGDASTFWRRIAGRDERSKWWRF